MFARLCAIAVLLVSAAYGGEFRKGVLLVDGRPFYPLGSWNSSFTTPEDMARLGMNTSFRPGGPSTPEAVEAFRPFMHRCAEFGIQVVPYLSFGGDGTTPWARERIEAISELADEPNLL